MVDNSQVSQNRNQKARSPLSQSFVANNLEMHRDSFLDIEIRSWSDMLQGICQCFHVAIRSTTSGRDFISSLVPTWVERVPTSGAGARRSRYLKMRNQDFAVRNFGCLLWFQALPSSSRSVAIIALLNQMGSFVPCPESQDEWSIEASSWCLCFYEVDKKCCLTTFFTPGSFFHARSQCCPSMFWLHHVWKLRNVSALWSTLSHVNKVRYLGDKFVDEVLKHWSQVPCGCIRHATQRLGLRCMWYLNWLEICVNETLQEEGTSMFVHDMQNYVIHRYICVYIHTYIFINP